MRKLPYDDGGIHEHNNATRVHRWISGEMSEVATPRFRESDYAFRSIQRASRSDRVEVIASPTNEITIDRSGVQIFSPRKYKAAPITRACARVRARAAIFDYRRSADVHIYVYVCVRTLRRIYCEATEIIRGRR